MVKVAGAVAPACTLVGEIPVTLGKGFNTSRGNELDDPPPPGGASGFMTETCKTPEPAISEELTEASTSDEFTKVVGRILPPIAAFDRATNPDPNILSVKGPPPVKTPVGDIEDICGIPLIVGLTVNIIPGVVVPPPGGGEMTVIVSVPGTAYKAGGTTAVSSWVFTKVPVSGMPFHSISDCCTKLLPTTVRVNGLGWFVVMFVGEIDFSVGLGKLVVWPHEIVTIATNISSQKDGRDIPCKLITPESVG